MGMRIVVVLNNDYAHLWANDEDLGPRILAHAHWAFASKEPFPGEEIPGGMVAECVHDNVQTLAIFNRYDMYVMSQELHQAGESYLGLSLRLLRSAAQTFGHGVYRNIFGRPKRLKH